MPRNSGIPHFLRIADALFQDIEERSPSTPLPSERALAKRFGVARNTASRALNELKRRGMAVRRQGSGTFRKQFSAKVVLGFGYSLEHESFARYFRVLTHRMALEGIELIVRDLGLAGEHLNISAELPLVRGAEAAVMMVPSHPEGLQAATRFRRRFPKLLPLLLLGDSLGLKLQGSHRFDLVNYDSRSSAHALLARLRKSGYRNPVFIQRSDVALFFAQEAKAGFLEELQANGVPNPNSHILEWNVEQPQLLRESPVFSRPEVPDVFVMTHGYNSDFRSACRVARVSLPPNVTFASVGESRNRYLDSAELADLSADLLANRLRKPNRINLHVTLAVPERFRTPLD